MRCADRFPLVAAAAGLLLVAATAGARPTTPPPDDELCHTPAASPTLNAAAIPRSLQTVTLPAVRLRQHTGQAVSFDASLGDDRPVLLNFVYTSCTTVCPPMSQIFAATQEKLGERREQVRMVSISIDPEHDNAARLREYATRFEAGPQWRFHTGSTEAIDAVQRAFNVYRPDKMGHTPVTFVRPKGSRQWLRLDGYASPDQLIREAFASR